MWKEVRTPLITVLFIFVGLFVFTKIFGPIPFSVRSVTTTKENHFTATGRGEVAAVPDTALINLGVTKNAPTVEAAQEEVNNIINQINKDLKGIGVEEKNIKTSNYSVSPQIDYGTGREVIRGYTVNANIEVRVNPIERANQAVDIATRNGANQVGGVQFVLDESEKEKLEDAARKIAIDNAKRKAQSIANAAGIKLGRIIDVQESEDGNQPIPFNRSLPLDAEVKQTEQTELNPGENKVVINVTLSYETY